MNKHAYLILAHNDPEHFGLLIDALDDARNDIYVHVDRKADISEFQGIKTKDAGIFFVKNRVDVRWGDPSLIDAELSLFKSAYDEKDLDKYSRFHLLSGADFPLKSQDYIYKFFESHPDEEFLEIVNATDDGHDLEPEIRKKCGVYHLFLPYIKDSNKFVANSANLARRSFMSMQFLLGIKRKYPWKELKKGSQWASLTPAFVGELLRNEENIRHSFRMTHCSDEIYKQTIAVAKGYKLYDGGNMRYIDFARGTRQSPYTFRESDFEELMGREELFARKFSSAVSGNLAAKILKNINKKID